MTYRFASGAFACVLLALGSVIATDAASSKSSVADKPTPLGYDYEHPAVQPSHENLDLAMYGRIRQEGFSHSHIMEYASGLFDGIGPRLTGSPNLAKANAWTRDQFTAMGCSNTHLESWGEFGFGWRQIDTSVFMTSPDAAVFVAQATPFSPPTAGTVNAAVIAVPVLKAEKDFDAWRGKLAGKIILYSRFPLVNADAEKPLIEHYDADKLGKIYQYPLGGDVQEQHVITKTPKEIEEVFKKAAFRERVAQFFADEHALAVLIPGYAGDAGVFKDDNGEQMGERVFMPDHRQPIPSAVLSNESFGRMSRLLEQHVPVSASVNIHTEFTGDHEIGYNTIAEIPGVDPALKEQVVMAGAHLDSWIAGTGATDDGAGTIIAMEAMRILAAVGVKPRRTIRVALWSGEEQDEFGSRRYVNAHFGTVGLSTRPEELEVFESVREKVGPLTRKPEHSLISGYFNLDNGGGKILGIYSENNAAIVPIFQQWIAPLRDLGVSTVTMREAGSTDHESFDQVGIPGFQFIQDPLDYETRSVHTNQDVYERLSPPDLKQAAIVEAIFLYDAAMRDQMRRANLCRILPRPRNDGTPESLL